MMKLVDTTIGHLIEFRRTVREIDLEEIEQVSGRGFDDLLVGTLAGCETLVDESGTVLGIGGIEGNNVIWLVTTTAIESRRIEFLRFSRRYLNELLKTYEYLTNVVYLRNQMHVDWLTWLGAEWLDTEGDFSLFVLKRKE